MAFILSVHGGLLAIVAYHLVHLSHMQNQKVEDFWA